MTYLVSIHTDDDTFEAKAVNMEHARTIVNDLRENGYMHHDEDDTLVWYPFHRIILATIEKE